jgi:hypothetical protein
MRLLFILIFVTFTAIAYAQNVPNGGFEEWQIEDYYVLQDWVSYGKPERTIDAKVGDYALKLVNFANSSNQYVSSSIYNINWTQNGVNKFPYSGDPLSLVFYAKYDLALGDSAHIQSTFYEKGRFSGYVDFKIWGNSNGEFLKYSVPITWFTSRTPDSVYIGMKSISSLQQYAHGNGYLTIDDFHYENIGKRTADVLNHDFELWVNQGVEYPKGWMPIDLLAYNDWGGFLRNPSVVSHSLPFRGTNCLAIHNFVSWSDIGEGFCFTGDTATHSYRPAFAVADRYAYLQGYYKLDQGGNDTAEISFNMFRQGQYQGEGKIRLYEARSDWTYFSIPITYYNNLSPDSATIRLLSSINQNNNSSNTVLYLDELAFVMTPDNRATIADLGSLPKAAYPNPFMSELVIHGDLENYQIRDLIGNKVAEGSLTNGVHRIDTEHIASGIYILITLDRYQKIWQQKIIKQ